MIITDYYRMRKLPGCEAKRRFDCISSTGSYEPFEQRAMRGRDKRFKFYYGVTPGTFRAEARSKAERVISDVTNISSVYTDLKFPLLGYGDVRGTNDALLFRFSEDYLEIEVFVARGLKNHKKGLFEAFKDCQLDDEVTRMRQQAKATNAPVGPDEGSSHTRARVYV